MVSFIGIGGLGLVSIGGGLVSALPSYRVGDINPLAMLDFKHGYYSVPWSFTRASVATYVDAHGAVQTASINKPRYERTAEGRRALLLEGSATNFLTTHTNPTNLAGFTKTGDANGVFSLVDDATELEAAGLSEIVTSGKVFKVDNSAGISDVWVNSAVTVGAVGPFAMQLQYRGGGADCSVYLTGQSSDRTLLESEGYARAVKVSTATDTTQKMVIRVSPGRVIYFTMAQLEAGLGATSYIPQSGVATTRAADIVAPIDVSGMDLSAGYSLVAKGQMDASAGLFDRVVQLDAGDDLSRQHFMWRISASSFQSEVYDNGVAQATFVASGGPQLGDDFAIAMAAGPDHFQTARNGVAGAKDSAVVFSAPVNLRLASSYASSRPARLLLESVLVYPGLLSEAQLIGVTA
ncbi:hypothetical protein SAMN05877809_1193 [Rhodobacter sp. JA431]|uniref:phage head spike fiber domain-containing protein n=1 Tax=Rhodobacter sp. JA431 TaxID=570013 RepID=UPI000BD97DA6|nr:hypothetical protein [Rhodobacter sp. JA431]SOC21871.1 hypothetical protein SAMN05877809_1193 [Rhodobacter sp. JA431]